MTHMPLVAVDTNFVDLVVAAFASEAHLDCAEAQHPPPVFAMMHPKLEAEVWSTYWLIALAPAWTSTLYTFSNLLYAEAAEARDHDGLLRTALDVLVRETQPALYRVPDPEKTPDIEKCLAAGLKPADARHLADAVGLGCSHLLTNDRQFRNRSAAVEMNWRLRLRRPSEFLVEAVQAGAPWSARAPWPWESLDRILSGSADLG